MSKLTPSDWENILLDLKDQQAILLIGPEFMQIEGKPLNKFLLEKIETLCELDIAYYYKRDGFFLFNSPAGKVRVAREFKRLFRKTTPDEVLLKRLAEIPFHLIISLNPDTFLSETFHAYRLWHQFNFFDPQNGEKAKPKMPTKERPLIYNLFGSKDKDNSLILDHDDVYDLFKSIFGEGFHSAFHDLFQNITTYFFLGFQFDKWYSQLLVKLLIRFGSKDKMISINKTFEDIDTSEFVMRQFEVQFMDKDLNFLEELYARCKNEGMLRVLPNEKDSTDLIDIRIKIANGNLIDALNSLKDFFQDSPRKDDIIALSARFNTLENRYQRRIISDETYNLEFNQIVDSILRLLENFES